MQKAQSSSTLLTASFDAQYPASPDLDNLLKDWDSTYGSALLSKDLNEVQQEDQFTLPPNFDLEPSIFPSENQFSYGDVPPPPSIAPGALQYTPEVVSAETPVVVKQEKISGADWFTPAPAHHNTPSKASSAKRKKSVKQEAIKDEFDSDDDDSQDFSPRKITAVSLPRETLLSMTSKDLEAHVRKIIKGRSITADEQKELRWQRRLVKNRESAQASRNRKKSRIEELEGQASVILHEQAKLRESIVSFEAANRSLKEEVVNLMNLIRSTPRLNALWNNMYLLKKRTEAKLATDSSSCFNNIKAAGMCLLIVMHSFQAILQQVQQNPHLLSNDSSAHSALIPTLPSFSAPSLPALTHVDKCDDSDDLVLVGGPGGDRQLTPDQFSSQQQHHHPQGQAPVLLMLVPHQNLGQVLRNRVVAQNALVLDLASATPITVYE